MPHTSIETHQELWALEEDSAQVTSTTIVEVWAAQTRPPTCYPNYLGMLQMLCAYIKLLTMLFGPACEHLAQVMAIFYILRDRMATCGSSLVGDCHWYYKNVFFETT